MIHTNLWMGLRYVSTVNQSHIWRMSSKFPRLRPIANPSQRLETEAKSGQSQKKSVAFPKIMFVIELDDGKIYWFNPYISW